MRLRSTVLYFACVVATTTIGLSAQAQMACLPESGQSPDPSYTPQVTVAAYGNPQDPKVARVIAVDATHTVRLRLAPRSRSHSRPG